MTETKHDLYDWRSVAGETEDRNGNAIPDKAHSATVSSKPDRIDITVPVPGGEGEMSVWIEMEAGQLRVHCYDPQHDEPVNVVISPEGIAVDTHDRDFAHGNESLLPSP